MSSIVTRSVSSQPSTTIATESPTRIPSGVDAVVLLGPSNHQYVGVGRAFADAARVHHETVTVVFRANGDIHVWTPFPEAVHDVDVAQVHRELPLEYDEGVDALARALRE